MRPVFRVLARTGLQEIFIAAALLLIISIALLMTEVGLSPALGTFIAGVVLSHSEYRQELESDVDPFKGMLLGVFFIAVGASIDFFLIAERPDLILGLVAALMATKFAVLFVLGRVFGLGTGQRLLFSFALAQRGEFAFVLTSFASQSAILGPEVTAQVVAIVALSMGLTPALMLVNERLLQGRLATASAKDDGPADRIEERNRVIVAGFGRFGTIVGRLLTANGVGVTTPDIDSDRLKLLRRLGIKAFYGDASRHDLLQAAGAEQAELLVIALDEAD